MVDRGEFQQWLQDTAAGYQGSFEEWVSEFTDNHNQLGMGIAMDAQVGFWVQITLRDGAGRCSKLFTG